jgi:hypothetical protein
VPHVTFRSGAKPDIPGIVGWRRAQGAGVYRRYQAVGGLTVDVKQLDADSRWAGCQVPPRAQASAFMFATLVRELTR